MLYLVATGLKGLKGTTDLVFSEMDSYIFLGIMQGRERMLIYTAHCHSRA